MIALSLKLLFMSYYTWLVFFISKGIFIYAIFSNFFFCCKILFKNSAVNRDDYVKIHWNNIQQGKQFNFRIDKNSKRFTPQYDLNSIMHYSSYAFSNNTRPTITKKVSLTLRLVS